MSVAPQLAARSGCPVCGSAGAPFVSLPFDDPPISDLLHGFYDGRLQTAALEHRRYELVDCGDCGLVYQVLVPNERYLDHLYRVAARQDPGDVGRGRGLDVRRRYASEIEQCVKYFGGNPSQLDVLDYGSGSGLWLDMARAYGCRTAGADVGHADLLERSGHEAVSPSALPTGRFHLVNTEQVVEHLVDPLTAVRAMASALRPGGILRVSVPNGSDIRERLEDADWTAAKGSPRSLNAVAPLEHLNCFDHRSLRRLAVRAGLEPFRYPLRQYLDPMERVRFVASALLRPLRRPKGTLLLFRKPAG